MGRYRVGADRLVLGLPLPPHRRCISLASPRQRRGKPIPHGAEPCKGVPKRRQSVSENFDGGSTRSFWRAPLGRCRVGAGVPTALPWAARGVPRWGGCVRMRAFGVRAPLVLTAPATTGAPFRRTEGAFPSSAHGNAVGKPSPIKSAALKGRPKSHHLRPQVRLVIHNAMPLQKRPVFVLECQPLVMFLLPLNVSPHCSRVGLRYGKRPITTLPTES